MLRLAYYLLLAGVASYLLYFAANRVFFIRANGYIAPDRLIMRADRGLVITRLDLARGDSVVKGRLLYEARAVTEGVSDSLTLESLRSERDLAQRKALLPILQAERSRKQALLLEMRRARALELNRERVLEMSRMETDIAELGVRVASLQAELAALRGAGAAVTERGRRRDQSQWLQVTAPLDGRVLAVERRPAEFAREGEAVMILENPSRVGVIAYFDVKEVRHLRVGKSVDIRFPDGTHGGGVIRRLYSAAQDEVSPLRRDYQPIEVVIKAEIETLDVANDKLVRFLQTDVQVQTGRWE